MAVKVNLHITQVQHIIELTINSLKRAEKAAANPAIAEIIRKDIADYTNARNTLAEIK